MDREFLEDFLEKHGKSLQKHWKNKVLQKVGDFLNFVLTLSHDISFADFRQVSQKKSYPLFIVLAKS